MSEKSNVAQLYEPPKRDAPALGMSVVMNMAGDRQATLQCFIASDAPLEEQNALMERMFQIGDRQKARYEIVGLRQTLAQHHKALKNMQEDIPRAESDHVRRQDELRAEMQKCRAESDAALQNGAVAWRNSGRRGDYVPDGSTKSLVSRMEAQIEKYADQMNTNDAEKAKFLAQIEGSMARFHQEIAAVEADIAEREALLG